MMAHAKAPTGSSCPFLPHKVVRISPSSSQCRCLVSSVKEERDKWLRRSLLHLPFTAPFARRDGGFQDLLITATWIKGLLPCGLINIVMILGRYFSPAAVQSPKTSSVPRGSTGRIMQPDPNCHINCALQRRHFAAGCHFPVNIPHFTHSESSTYLSVCPGCSPPVCNLAGTTTPSHGIELI